MKKKICSVCKDEHFLWKSKPPLCKSCARQYQQPIKKISKSYQETLKEYAPLRAEFLKNNPLCQMKLQGCTYNAECIHHMQGKKSKELYLDSTKWKASCLSCNRVVEEILDPYSLGLKLKQNSKCQK